MSYDREALERELATYEAQGKTDRAKQVKALLGHVESATVEAPEAKVMPKATPRKRD